MSDHPAFVVQNKYEYRKTFSGGFRLFWRITGQAVDVIIAPQGHAKTRLQESGFHAMITPWAHSEGHRIDDLKRDLLRAVFGTLEHTNPLTGEIESVLAEPSSAKLNRAQYCELIERTLELGAECGVVLVAPNEYRELKAKGKLPQQRQAVSA